jgi:hypothetical protein
MSSNKHTRGERMEFDSLLENGSEDELLAFLSCYVPIAFSDTEVNKIPKINFREMNELITKGPKDYINPLCVSACEDLWKKNIFVLASMDVDNDLYLILDKLSNDNMKILKSKIKKNPENYYTNLGSGKYFGVKVTDYAERNDVEEQFKELVSDFTMQDIQRGYLTEKTFLMNICNCEKVDGMNENKKQELQVVFDVQKMEKTFKEYLNDSGYSKFYVPEEHRIYLNEYYYNAHQNYMNKEIV